MYDMSQASQPMNFSDLFAAQSLGMNPPPMSGAQSPWSGMMAGGQPPMSAQQPVQMPPEINHLNDVIQQYTQNKQDQTNNSGLVQQILSNRMQPTLDDASQSTAQTAQSFLAPHLFQPQTPDQAMAQRYQSQLAPYTQGMALANSSAELTGRNQTNAIQQQTGLPMAQAMLQKEQMANDIMSKTGMDRAQAEIALQHAQAGQATATAGYYGSALQRDLAEKQFDYQNNPANIQARMMAQYMSGLSGSGGVSSAAQPTNLPQSMPSPVGALPSTPISTGTSPQQQGIVPTQQSSGQPAFNPMGAMLAKQFGLENMQIGANGQPEMIPGTVTPGQKEIDTNFATNYQTYANAGGAKRTQNALDIIDQTINKLQNGELDTGGLLGRVTMTPQGEPSRTGMIMNAPVLVARNQIANAILPQAKALFGARVTNFDAQSLINSQGLDPMADKNTNIEKLQRLKASVLSGQQDLASSGQYFSQHGTLSGYQPQINVSQPITVISPDGKVGTIDPSELQPALANGWKQVQ